MNEFVTGCRAGEIFDDLASAALFAEYEAECGNPLLGPIAPDRKQYESLEWTGLAFFFAAYIGTELCGFGSYLKGTPPHYGGRPVSVAVVESVFVSRAARAHVGKLLLDTIERHAKDNGCSTVLYSAPVGSRLARLFFLLSDEYLNTNHTFAKRLM